jgi:serine/threonine-protein kinase RsbW
MTSTNTIELDLPATHKYLNVLGDCIAGMLARVDGLADYQTASYDVQLGVHEVCTNIVDHAYRDQPEGRINVSMTLTDDSSQFIVEVRDTGHSFDPALIPLPEFETEQVRGYGLFLIYNLLDSVNYCPSPGQNTWHLIKNL